MEADTASKTITVSRSSILTSNYVMPYHKHNFFHITNKLNNEKRKERKTEKHPTHMLVDLRWVFLKWREINNLLLLMRNLMSRILITQTGIVLKRESSAVPRVMTFTQILKNEIELN